MADSTLSPNMNLPIPTVGEAPGPTWAQLIDVCLALIDAHTHASSSGVQITPDGLNINADLSFNNTSNAIAMRSLRFNPQASPIAASGSDIGCLYEAGVDLYYNDGAGNQIRITQSGSVAGASGTITGLPSGTASAAYASGSGTFVFQQATSTAANFDIGSIAIRYPGSYPTPSGNYIQLQAPSALATGYSLTFPPSAAAAVGSFLTSDTGGALSYTNTDNTTLEINSSTLRVKALGIGTNELADNSVTPIKLSAANIQIAGATGVTSITSTSYVDITNLSATITTTGRPVMVMIYNNSVGPGNGISSTVSGQPSTQATIRFLRGSQPLTQMPFGAVVGGATSVTVYAPPSSFLFIDTPAAGTWTYKVQGKVSGSLGGTLNVDDVNLTVFEM